MAMWTRRMLTALRLRRRPESVRETIAEARKVSREMGEPVHHNPEGPDADLRYAPYGPGRP